MDIPKPVPLRSPRESLGGYILLPRLIDKVRLLAQGQLPQAYAANVLRTGFTLDGRFLTFAGLNAGELRQVILSSRTDDEGRLPIKGWVGARQPYEEGTASPYSHRVGPESHFQMAGLTL
jgi:hypothetical protein